MAIRFGEAYFDLDLRTCSVVAAMFPLLIQLAHYFYAATDRWAGDDFAFSLVPCVYYPLIPMVLLVSQNGGCYAPAMFGSTTLGILALELALLSRFSPERDEIGWVLPAICFLMLPVGTSFTFVYSYRYPLEAWCALLFGFAISATCYCIMRWQIRRSRTILT